MTRPKGVPEGTEPPAGGALAYARKRLKTKGSKHAPHDNKGAAYVTRATAAALAKRPVVVSLRFRHSITSAPRCTRQLNAQGKYVYEAVEGTGGTQTYGPGSVRVPPDVAAVLREMERNASATIAAETTERAVLIGGRGNRLIDVPPELFGEYLGWATPIGVFR